MTVKEQALAEEYAEAIQIELHDSGKYGELLSTVRDSRIRELKVDKELWAYVVKAQLLLILVTDSDGHDHEITYSGGFTVAWGSGKPT